MIVKLCKTTGNIEIMLPDNLSAYKSELESDLIEVFSFESSSKNTIILMNQFVINWFANKGITIPDEN